MSGDPSSQSRYNSGREYPSPATHVIGFGYDDGVTDGVLKTADGTVYRFDLIGDEFDPDRPNRRTFELSALDSGVLDRVAALLAPYQPPVWPVWVPRWTFPTDDARKQIDDQIDHWLTRVGPPRWRVEGETVTGFLTVSAAG